MRKLIAFAVVAAGAAAFITIPAAAKPPTGNGRIVFTRFDPALDQDVVYTVNPDGSHEQPLMVGAESGQNWESTRCSRPICSWSSRLAGG